MVALVGVSGSGKSTFAGAHFKPTEVLSSDYFRALVSDDEGNQQATEQAFDALYYVAAKRLELGLLTVIDATNVQKGAREAVLRLTKDQNCHAVAIVLDVPEKTCCERNVSRPRRIDDRVVARQAQQLRRSVKSLRKEGFRYVYVLSEADIADCEIVRTPMWSNKKADQGPFDVIGDVHGCFDELCALLGRLGYAVDAAGFTAKAPEGRKAVFVGDLCDRGPGNVEVLKLVMNMVRAGVAYCVAGNHDVKLLRRLHGADVRLTHGMDVTVRQLSTQSDDFIADVTNFLDGLLSHYMFDGGNLVVAHAGLIEKYQGRASGRVRAFCLYGDTTGETDEYGLPVRLPWANDYRGKALVVYGHTPTVEAEMVNNTICVDTGCVFGGKLTAFRYPEREVVSVPSKREYYAPIRPFLTRPSLSEDTLKIDDVTGPRYLSTRLRHSVKIEADIAVAALEVMSRFAADPHWLIYLPPTMSPCETSGLPGYLEYPAEAFGYYKARGVNKVVCEQKHMGSRAVIVLCRDAETARRRFKVGDGSAGIIYTRTGRHFFDDQTVEEALLARLRKVLDASHFWDDFATDWVCLDTELMPWSAKARQLLEDQYAPVASAGREGLKAAVGSIGEALRGGYVDNESGNGVDLRALLADYQGRAESVALYAQAYRRYCWDVSGLDDYRIAPFHLLATEGETYSDRDHMWHMAAIETYATGADPVFMATKHLLVDLLDDSSVEAGVRWWEDLTESGGEGMVVKPLDFIAMRGTELLQPAVKCRGREYLRIIYGPEYTLRGNLDRLKKRSLAKKRHLALNEFALGMESLERFVQRDPLFRVHECVFGVLAMESEPVDPRL